jgi:lipopolysaccharide transport system permease protein
MRSASRASGQGAAPGGADARPITEIRPRQHWVGFDLANLWRYRELLYFLVWRDLKVRYRQTFLGAAWAVLQPFVTMIVFTVIFGRLVGVSTDGVPYPLFAFAALVPWTFVSTGVTQAANSLVGSQNLLKKVYFPRLVIPVAAVTAGLADLAIAGIVLAGMIAVLGSLPGPTTIWVVPLIALAMITALGVGIWLAALNVRYRDVRYVVPFLLQVWLFATPVAYPSSLIDERWRLVYALDPMVGVVEGIRWALFGRPLDPLGLVVVGSVSAAFILITGVAYFRHVEGAFADVV